MLTTVRPWRPADRPAVLALNAELQEFERALRPSRRPGAEMTEEYVAAIEARLAAKGDDAALLVAEAADGTVVGFVTCFMDESDLEQERRELRIEDLVVSGRCRRRGVGRSLIAAACRFAAERGAALVEISVLAANAEAIAAYAALGFRPAYSTLELRLSGQPSP